MKCSDQEKIKELILRKLKNKKIKYSLITLGFVPARRNAYRQAINQLVREGKLKKERSERGYYIADIKYKSYEYEIQAAIQNKKPLGIFEFLHFHAR